MSNQEPATILLIDDHPMLRTGVKQLISMAPDITVVGEASNGEQGIELAESLDPDLILLDLNMPGMNGLETLDKLREKSLSGRIVVFSVSNHEEDVVTALKRGADGYLLKDMEPEDLEEMITTETPTETRIMSIYVQSTSPKQAKQIADKYGVPHISTGDIFRANIKNGTELGKKAKEYMDQGLLVPDELTCDLVMDRIQQDDCKNGFILDGFPRTIPQAEALTSALEKIGQKMDYAIDVDVPDENIVNRMSGRRACLNCGATYHIVSIPTKVEGICDRCGSPVVLRDDDKPETVQKRLTVYHDQTQPLIDYYEKQSILKTVDGTKSMEAEFDDITAILGA